MRATLLYSVLDYDEIVRRILKITDPLEGPSGYPLTIKIVCDNSTEPPVIFVDLYEGADHSIFDYYTDQNTLLEDFGKKMQQLSEVVLTCFKAIENRTSYDEERGKKKVQEENSDLPF